MSSRKLTEVMFNDMLASYRDLPGNITHAAKAAGVTRDTARKAWFLGWRNKPWGRIPICTLLAQEAEAARATRIQMERDSAAQDAERSLQARIDAIQARAEEAVMAKHGRKGATNLAIVATKLTILVDAIVNEMQKRLSDPAQLSGMKDAEMRRWIATAANVMHHAESTMRLALEIERIVTGEPIAVIGVRVDKMSPEQMVEELSGVARTLERAQGIAERDALAKAQLAEAEATDLKKTN